MQVTKISRDACFLVAKAAERFLAERAWEAQRICKRQRRKTIHVSDLVTAITDHPNPESVHFLCDELKSPPPPQAPKSKGRPKATTCKSRKTKADTGAKADVKAGGDKPDEAGRKRVGSQQVAINRKLPAKKSLI